MRPTTGVKRGGEGTYDGACWGVLGYCTVTQHRSKGMPCTSTLNRLELCKEELVMQLGGLSSTADLGIEAQPAPPPPQQQCRGGAASPSSQELPPAAPPSRQDSSSAAIAAPPPRLACQLGAVLGLQADCCRRAGDAERAEALYQTSAETLRPLALADAEVRPRQLGVCVPDECGDPAAPRTGGCRGTT